MTAMTSFVFNVTFDCADPRRVAAFWAGATGYEVAEERTDFVRLRATDPRGVRHLLFFQVPDAAGVGGAQPHEVGPLLGHLVPGGPCPEGRDAARVGAVEGHVEHERRHDRHDGRALRASATTASSRRPCAPRQYTRPHDAQRANRS